MKIKKAFTLVELLVVMAIIGVLASLAVGNFRTAQARGRDATRKSDLKQIAHALELYYADYGQYPNASGTLIAGCPSTPVPGTACTWGTGWFRDSDTKTTYFKTLPADPVSQYNYYYRIVPASNNQKYQIFAYLEIQNDPDKIPGLPSYSCGPTTTQRCNFGISSPNASPLDL